MPIFDYQFATVDQLLVARAAVANDWQGRILTSLAAANGAGFVTIITNLATKGWGTWLVWTLAAAAVCFFIGLGFSTGALFQFSHRYELKAHSLHQDMQNEWLRQQKKKTAPGWDAAKGAVNPRQAERSKGVWRLRPRR